MINESLRGVDVSDLSFRDLKLKHVFPRIERTTDRKSTQHHLWNHPRYIPSTAGFVSDPARYNGDAYLLHNRRGYPCRHVVVVVAHEVGEVPG